MSKRLLDHKSIISKGLEYYASIRSESDQADEETTAAADLGRPEVAAALDALTVYLTRRGLDISAIEVTRSHELEAPAAALANKKLVISVIEAERSAELNALAVALANRGLAISAIEVARVLDVDALEKNTQPAADEGGKPWLN